MFKPSCLTSPERKWQFMSVRRDLLRSQNNLKSTIPQCRKEPTSGEHLKRLPKLSGLAIQANSQEDSQRRNIYKMSSLNLLQALTIVKVV